MTLCLDDLSVSSPLGSVSLPLGAWIFQQCAHVPVFSIIAAPALNSPSNLHEEPLPAAALSSEPRKGGGSDQHCIPDSAVTAPLGASVSPTHYGVNNAYFPRGSHQRQLWSVACGAFQESRRRGAERSAVLPTVNVHLAGGRLPQSLSRWPKAQSQSHSNCVRIPYVPALCFSKILTIFLTLFLREALLVCCFLMWFLF